MALTLENLKALCEGEKLKYFVDPNRPVVMMGFGGIHGRYQVIVALELEGRFMQVRTIAYLHCPADHPHILPVLKIIGHLDYRLRMTKFGWDPSDGEIVAYADVWLEDGDLTQAQFSALFKSVLPAIDLNYKRLTQTMETGQDPGEVLLPSADAPGLPAELRALLEEIARKEKEKKEQEAKAKDKDKDKDEGKGSDSDSWPTV